MSLAKPTPYGNAEDLAMFNRSLVAQLRKERATIQRVRALHEHRAPESPYVEYCEHCGADWPCQTVRVLDA
ncbi:hypothetical protein I8D64_03185 [Brachybacterium sp. MASK1Z-5]|uniref:Uncharacterized protein n=1 Tax=Brachybacterium halotolerans TaxID=2795215 RepID=A0ABS1B877_9MICO|nr:hypothetical protein [Brachybacterium halotolerans]MBK0330402.1 hypothetical protein [Brachybacterium halotolerans]